jgi:magnesium chelatase subunit I
MIMGDRGTGKSTTIRALADLLPEIKVVDKDPFNSGVLVVGLTGNNMPHCPHVSVRHFYPNHL